MTNRREYRVTFSDGGAETIAAADLEDARAQAIAMIHREDYDCGYEPDYETTIWVDATIEGPDGEETSIVAQLDPPEPDCESEAGHEWEDGPVYGDGGGIAWTSTCRHCAWRKRYTNWGQRPDNGRQGYPVTSYDREGSR